MKQIQEGFHLTLDMAIEFYQKCIDENITSYEARKEVLRQFVKDKKAQYLRDVGEVIKGKRVLRVEKKQDE